MKLSLGILWLIEYIVFTTSKQLSCCPTAFKNLGLSGANARNTVLMAYGIAQATTRSRQGL